MKMVTGMRRDGLAGMPMVLICALVLGGCAAPGSIKSKENAYSYLGRIVEAIDETVTEQHSRPSNNPLRWGFGAIGALLYESIKEGDDNVIVNRRSTYRKYKVALEQGEQITLRSHVPNIGPGDCVRVWIVGPGVSPVYWYGPDISQIEAAEGCRASAGVK
jgi:hypothetical protein